MQFIGIKIVALIAVITAGCGTEIDPLYLDDLADEFGEPIDRGPEPANPDEDEDHNEIGPPIAEAPPAEDPEEWDEDGEPGVIEGEFDGEDGEHDDDGIGELGGQCGPDGLVCDGDTLCVEHCTPSQCDDEGRCTADCRLTYECVEVQHMDRGGF